MSISDFDSILDMIAGGGNPSYTGKLIGPKNALSSSAFWSCVNILADDWATLPNAPQYWVEEGISHEAAREHYLWPLMMHDANPRMTAFRFKKVMETWRNVWGNAYAEIEMNGRGQVVALWPWHPDRVKVYVRNPNDVRSPLIYQYVPFDRTQNPIVLDQDHMLHIRGTSIDGVTGLAPVTVHRQRLAIDAAMTEFEGRFYSNGANIHGLIQHPGKLGEKAARSLEQSMEKYKGLDNAHRLMILEEGMTYKETMMRLTDAQFLESMNYNGEDTCRIMKVPQHRAGYHQHSTNNNITQLSMEYVQYTMFPNASNWNAEIMSSLLSTRDRRDIYMQPDFSYLLEGDPEMRSKLYQAAGNLGAFGPDDVRHKEGLNPLKNGIGAIPRVPLNTAPLGSDAAAGKLPQIAKGNTPAEIEKAKGLIGDWLEEPEFCRGMSSEALFALCTMTGKKISSLPQ